MTNKVQPPIFQVGGDFLFLNRLVKKHYGQCLFHTCMQNAVFSKHYFIYIYIYIYILKTPLGYQSMRLEIKQADLKRSQAVSKQTLRVCLECDKKFSLFEFLISFQYYSWVLLHILILFMDPIVLFNQLKKKFYTFSKQFSIFVISCAFIGVSLILQNLGACLLFILYKNRIQQKSKKVNARVRKKKSKRAKW